MKIQSTDTVDSQCLKAVVSGLSGAGKTTLAKSLKADFAPIILSAEGGLLSLKGSGMDYIDMTTDEEGKLIPLHMRGPRIKAAYNYLMTDAPRKKYKTVVIDSLTEIGQVVYEAAKLKFPDRKDMFPMWGYYGDTMRDLIKSFRDLPGYHVVFTCLTKIEKDDTGKRIAAFDLSGSIADKLPGFFDFVFYLRADATGARELVCQPIDSLIAKDRSGKLNKIEAADLGAIFSKVLK